MKNESAALDYALQFGRGIAKNTAKKFVGMYVNEDTLDLGEEGKAALEWLYRDGSEKGHHRSQPDPAKLCDIPGDFHHFLLDRNLRSLLERCGWNFLHDVEWMGGGDQGLGTGSHVSPPSLV